MDNQGNACFPRPTINAFMAAAVDYNPSKLNLIVSAPKKKRRKILKFNI